MLLLFHKGLFWIDNWIFQKSKKANYLKEDMFAFKLLHSFFIRTIL